MKTLRNWLIAVLLLGAPAVAIADEAPKADTTQEDPSEHFNFTDHLSPFGADSYKNQKIETAEGEEPMSVPFVYFLINFGLLLVLLGWKAGPLARDMAAKRSDEIKNALDEAARLRNAAKGKLDEYSTKLKKAEGEIDAMIQSMRESAEAEKQRIIANAEAQAAAMKKDAEERIAAEIERARHTLQQEVVAAAATVAEKVLREKTTPTDQSNLVDTFIRGIA